MNELNPSFSEANPDFKINQNRQQLPSLGHISTSSKQLPPIRNDAQQNLENSKLSVNNNNLQTDQNHLKSKRNMTNFLSNPSLHSENYRRKVSGPRSPRGFGFKQYIDPFGEKKEQQNPYLNYDQPFKMVI